jgi:hypothetical protein
MTMEAEVGAGVEVGGASLDALVALGGSLNGVVKHLEKLQSLEEAYQFGSVEVPLRAASVSGASGALVIDLGGPTYGRKWEVKRLSVGGTTWASAVGGIGQAVISPNAQTNPAISDVADVAATLPSIAFYSTGQFVVRHPNHLYIVIVTPTASTQYAVGGSATELPDRRVRLNMET